MSRHLRVLKEAQLVSDEAVGAQRAYRLEPEGVNAIRAYFERLWGEAAARDRIAAENTKRQRCGATPSIAPLVVEFFVDVDEIHAFDVWVTPMALWWPAGHTRAGAPAEIGASRDAAAGSTRDGTELEWGEVADPGWTMRTIVPVPEGLNVISTSVASDLGNM